LKKEKETKKQKKNIKRKKKPREIREKPTYRFVNGLAKHRVHAGGA
jgi:hypothetical protein